MDNMKITDALLQDEVMQFISQRHHTTAKEVLSCFMELADDEHHDFNPHSVDLEENEILIIRDLIHMYQ